MRWQPGMKFRMAVSACRKRSARTWSCLADRSQKTFGDLTEMSISIRQDVRAERYADDRVASLRDFSTWSAPHSDIEVGVAWVVGPAPGVVLAIELVALYLHPVRQDETQVQGQGDLRKTKHQEPWRQLATALQNLVEDVRLLCRRQIPGQGIHAWADPKGRAEGARWLHRVRDVPQIDRRHEILDEHHATLILGDLNLGWARL
jgi:hypothetical protein